MSTSHGPVFKIGDLGLVTKISDPNVEEEGDSRYLDREVLKGALKQL